MRIVFTTNPIYFKELPEPPKDTVFATPDLTSDRYVPSKYPTPEWGNIPFNLQPSSTITYMIQKSKQQNKEKQDETQQGKSNTGKEWIA